MRKAILMSLALLALALSGCTGDDSPADDLKDEFSQSNSSSSSGSSSGSSSQSTGEPGGEGSEEPGTIVINAAASAHAGNVPFEVALQIAGKALNSDGTEGDNASIEWAVFDAHENSTSGIQVDGIGLPTSVNVTFTEVGNFSLAIGGQLEGYQSGFQVLNFTVLPADVEVPVGGVQETWNMRAGSGGASDWQLSKSQPSEFAGHLIVAQAGAAQPYTSVFVADVPSTGHAGGVSVDGSMTYFTFGGLPHAGISFVLKADGVEIGSASVAPGLIATPPTGATAEFSFVTTGPVDVGAILTLEVTVSNLNYHEPSQGSFTIG